MFKGQFTPSESERESEKDQRTSEKDQRINGKHQRKFPLSLSLSLDLITTLSMKIKPMVSYYVLYRRKFKV